jgi:ribokinase
MIHVFGSLNVDLVVPVDHLPKPGETVLGPSYRAVAGGKGANQALAARRAGSAVRMIGAVGRDGFAGIALAELERDGVDVSAVARVEAPTGAAFIGVDPRGENQIIVASGANLETRATQAAEASWRRGETLLLQMEVPAAESEKVAARARAAGLRTLLNLAPALPLSAAALANLDWLVVNEVEVVAMAAQLGGAALAPEAAMRFLAGRGIATVVTLGPAGAIAGAGGKAWRIGALPIRPVDSTGAGDAFVGVFASRLDAGDEPLEAIRWASVAGALACLVEGAQPSLPTGAAIQARLADLAPAREL